MQVLNSKAKILVMSSRHAETKPEYIRDAKNKRVKQLCSFGVSFEETMTRCLESGAFKWANGISVKRIQLKLDRHLTYSRF